ncbi:CvpA family protein [Fructobacillus fructosus]|uniref:Regulator of purF expression and biofilm formation (CvpA) n=1 Tax=Fructobacillus fructosus TaxID=1631 RepID=A0ABN9YR65_9LACO|nr:CvpA family protein [Fructobacillus fructosus]MBC9118941.1 CvpA family protein [Fructobacillus fructosus]MBD9365831.1 CvpA family protein [Leuconostoc mesenteroides]MCK8638519.1 CvpA family protein [Fructobacillus fructosus]CAK1239919.1 Colicin V production accessory protein CvpA [Fructobacillus fructosus]
MILLWIVVIFILLMAYSGYRTGFVTALTRLILWAVIFYAATVLSKPLSSLFAGWTTGQFARPSVPSSWASSGSTFLASGIAFALILIIGSLIGHFLLRPVHFIRRVPFLGQLDGLLGATLSIIFALVFAFFCLELLSVIPNAWIQGQFTESSLLNEFLDQFPIISNKIYQWWL